jgi:leucyl-tRNA synthetase
MELVNFLYQFPEKKTPIYQEALSILVLLLSPFAPHICEELWQKMGHKDSIVRQKWPFYREEFLRKEETTIVIQVNGKLRDKVQIQAGTEKEEIEKIALQRERIKKYTSGKGIKKIIYVPDKLVNIVVG